MITELIGVYDANGTLRGELAYFVGARLGLAHCSLCAVTHGRVREKQEWKACRAGLPIPFATFHRDDQPADVRAAAEGRAPVVVGRTDRGELVVLLHGAAITACAGSPAALVSAVEAEIADRGLSFA